MARTGEVRVVPFRLHNPWRREREVTLELGPWHQCSGDDLDVRARLEETKLVLAPCEDRVVRLLVTARGTGEQEDGGDDGNDTAPGDDKVSRDDKATDDNATKPGRANGPAGVRVEGLEPAEAAAVGIRGTRDVDSCASVYADVRFEGCARPQRVALVVLPADCDPVEVGCDCGCCC